HYNIAIFYQILIPNTLEPATYVEVQPHLNFMGTPAFGYPRHQSSDYSRLLIPTVPYSYIHIQSLSVGDTNIVSIMHILYGSFIFAFLFIPPILHYTLTYTNTSIHRTFPLGSKMAPTYIAIHGIFYRQPHCNLCY